MRVFSIAKGFHYLAKRAYPELSQKELDRLRAMRLWQQTKDAKLVCETFGISRATLYRWIQRFDPKDLSSLKERSRRPRRLRKPTWSHDLIMEVKALRRQYPRWGKEKLAALLAVRGRDACVSTVGRILKVSEEARGYRGASQTSDLSKETHAKTLRGKEAKGVYPRMPW